MNVGVAGPEIALTLFALAALLSGAWQAQACDKPQVNASSLRLTGLFVFVGLAVATLCATWIPAPALGFEGAFVQDGWSRFAKFGVLAASALSLAMAWPCLDRYRCDKPEFFVLAALSTVGMMLAVSANDWLVVYASLELQTLPLYVLAGFAREQEASNEAGLKYFALGAMASAVLLYGLSLLYGAAGSTGFAQVAQALSVAGAPSPGVLTGLALFLAAMAFKLGAVPFHMWLPDVYEGAPAPSVVFFAVAPKIAALAVATRALLSPLGGLIGAGHELVVALAMASMALGAVAGLAQKRSFKRLMAYSSIAHMGTALVGLAAGSAYGASAVLAYVALYGVGTLGAFSVMLALRRKGAPVDDLEALDGLGRTHPFLAAAMAAFLFSLAGVPPFAGFFGKYMAFYAAVQAGMTPLAVFGAMASVIAAAYYLRLVKRMYLDGPGQDGLGQYQQGQGQGLGALDVDPPAFALQAIAGVLAVVAVGFALWPAPLLDQAQAAARGLLGWGAGL